MKRNLVSNIAVKPNIHFIKEEIGEDSAPDLLWAVIPGDLRVEFLGTRDARILRRELTKIQREEYEQSRFFQKHGQNGVAYE